MRAPLRSDRRARTFRRMIFRRDGGLCRYKYPGCTTVATQWEHLTPLSRGGAMFDEANSFSVCHSCHREKERRERAGEPVDGFLNADAVGNAQLSTYTYGRTERNRRNLLLSGDYSRREPEGAA